MTTPTPSTMGAELPPLPNPRSIVVNGPNTVVSTFSHDQLRAYALAAIAADRQSASRATPEGWVPCFITYEGEEPEEVAFGPQHMMDRLKKWLTSYFAMVYAARYPDPARAADPVRSALAEFVAAMDEKKAANEAMDQTVQTAERSFAATDRLWANLEPARAALTANQAAEAPPVAVEATKAVAWVIMDATSGDVYSLACQTMRPGSDPRWQPLYLATPATPPLAGLEIDEKGAWKSLCDSEWVNVVNHPKVLYASDKEEAVAEAFKLIEAKLRELNANNKDPK